MKNLHSSSTTLSSYRFNINAFQILDVQFDLGPWLANLNQANRSNHSITVSILGCTNSNWNIGANVLLWRGKETITGGSVTTTIRPALTIPDSVCDGENLTDAGECTFAIAKRSLAISGAVTLSDGSSIRSSASYSLQHYDNVISWGESNMAYNQTYYASSGHKAAWSSSHCNKKGKKLSTLSELDMSYSWLNSGVAKANGKREALGGIICWRDVASILALVLVRA